jgi:hypothetical protein
VVSDPAVQTSFLFGGSSCQHAAEAARNADMEIQPIALTRTFPISSTVKVRRVAMAATAKRGDATNPTPSPALIANSRLGHESGPPSPSEKARMVPKTALAEQVTKIRQSPTGDKILFFGDISFLRFKARERDNRTERCNETIVGKCRHHIRIRIQISHVDYAIPV